LSKAINETYDGEHESRAFVKKRPTFTDFPIDILLQHKWRNNNLPPWIKEYWETADVVHRHAFWHWANGWAVQPPGAGRILHQHGRFDRSTKAKDIWASDQQRGQLRIVSTISLLPWVHNDPELWFPPPMDIKRLDAIKAEHRKETDRVVVMHSPTHRGRKNTTLFLHVMKEIRKKHKNVQVVLMEGKTNVECLQARANADICFDQLLLQYGTSGLEAMTMGQPVIAGCKDWTYDNIKKIVGVPPFVRAERGTLFEVIDKLVSDRPYREYIGAVGRAYIEKFHSFENTARIAIETYERAIEMRRGDGSSVCSGERLGERGETVRRVDDEGGSGGVVGSEIPPRVQLQPEEPPVHGTGGAEGACKGSEGSGNDAQRVVLAPRADPKGQEGRRILRWD
jgi:glycosyltransferase involved in cell wall biosynthesis